MRRERCSDWSDAGVSEAIGSIMLISVVVLAVAITGVFLTSQPPPQKLPSVNAIIATSGNQITIYHDGGDMLRSSELSILVNGNPVAFTKGGIPAPWTWAVGDTLNYTMTSGTTDKVQIIYVPGSYTIASADFGQIGSGPPPTTAPTTTAPTTAPPAPTVSGISPPGGNSGSPVAISSITGTNFVTGATAKLTRAGYGDIPITGISVTSGTQMTGGTADLTGAAAGSWNVVVTNPDLRSGTLSNGFTITNAAPTVTAITPSSGTRGTTVGITNLAGTGFLPGATVRLNRTDSSPITASNIVVVSPAKITCDLPLPAGATVGPWDVVVTNPDLKNGTLLGGFTVSAVPPAVTAIMPNSSLQTTPVPVTVGGSNFQSGANLTLRRAGSPDIVATGVVVVSSNVITASLNLATATPGLWDVVVTNADGLSGTLTGGYLVKNPTPAVTAITPNTGIRGWSVSITNLAGNNFRTGAVVRLVNTSAGPDIVATNVVVVSATQITCTFDLTGANAARRNVTVTNPYSDTGTGANLFSVTSNAPTLSARNPTSGSRGWPVTIVSLTGTGFQPGAGVRLTRSGYSDVVATGVNVASPTSINAGTFSLVGVAAGTWNIVVINTDGKASNTMTFTVNSQRPTLSSCTPNTGARGTTVTITNLAGNYFQPGATVTFTRGATTLTLTGITVVSPTQIIGTLVIPSGATTGLYSVTVTNTDGQTRSANLFTVT